MGVRTQIPHAPSRKISPELDLFLCIVQDIGCGCTGLGTKRPREAQGATTRGRELPYPDARDAEETAAHMQECYADEGVDRSRESAVLVRASAPDGREVFHGDERCGLATGEGRQIDDAGWMLLRDAQGVGYRAGTRCGSPSIDTA